MLFRRGSHVRSLAADVRRARKAAESGDADTVARRCQTALATFDQTPVAQVSQSAVQALDELVDLCSEICRYDLALESLKRLLCLDPESIEIELELAICHFELTQFEEAQERLTRMQQDCAPHPEIEWYLGALAERHGDFDTAQRLFLHAHNLDRKAFPPPLTYDDRDVEKLVDEVVDDLPRDTFDAIEEVPIFLDPIPSLEILRLSDPPFSPFILGLHHGTDLRHGSIFHTVPAIDGIRVFPRNVAKYSWSKNQFEQELVTTLLHEIGHRLGLDEDDLWERGL